MYKLIVSLSRICVNMILMFYKYNIATIYKNPLQYVANYLKNKYQIKIPHNNIYVTRLFENEFHFL